MINGINRQASFCQTLLEIDIESSNKINNINIQRQISTDEVKKKPEQEYNLKAKPLKVIVTGLTHLVPSNVNSLMTKKYNDLSIQVQEGDKLVIDTAVAIHSRRGPNHELYDQVDLRNKENYLWFKVLNLNIKDYSEKNFYIRECTFLTESQEIVNCPLVEKSSDYRHRGYKAKDYNYPCQLAHLKPAPTALKEIRVIIENIRVRNVDESINIKGLINEFRESLSTHLKGTFISFLYGSYATGSQKKKSDIDVMFSCDNQTYQVYRNELVPLITSFLQVLHNKVGADVDDEVPAESKHLISAQELIEAASGQIYYPQGDNNSPKIHTLSYFLDKDVMIDEIKKSDSGRFGEEFLASKYLRSRLIFNILTSPNEVSSNNSEATNHIKNIVKKNLIRLSDDLRKSSHNQDPQSVNHLLQSDSGDKGEMYLGYKEERNGVVEHLQQLIEKKQTIF